MGVLKLKVYQNPFSTGTPLGELTTLGLGRGHPLPIPLFLDAFGV